MWVAKKKFGNYEKGDQVKEEDAKRFGSLYCAQSGDAPATVGDNDADKKPEAEENSVNTKTGTEETPAADPETASEVITEPEKPKAKKRR